MPQLFISRLPQKGETITVEGEDFHHTVRVRREKLGDSVFLRSPDGSRAVSIISDIRTHSLSLTVETILAPEIVPYILALAMPLLKSRKNDLIIEKGVESGITAFYPVIYERSIPDPSSVERKVLRWKKIAAEAFKQSNAVFPAVIHDPLSSSMLVKKSLEYQTAIIADVHEDNPLTAASVSRSVIAAVGPEGGFSDDERTLFKNANWTSRRVSTNQLRAETASIVIPAMIRHFMDLPLNLENS